MQGCCFTQSLLQVQRNPTNTSTLLALFPVSQPPQGAIGLAFSNDPLGIVWSSFVPLIGTKLAAEGRTEDHPVANGVRLVGDVVHIFIQANVPQIASAESGPPVIRRYTLPAATLHAWCVERAVCSSEASLRAVMEPSRSTEAPEPKQTLLRASARARAPSSIGHVHASSCVSPPKTSTEQTGTTVSMTLARGLMNGAGTLLDDGTMAIVGTVQRTPRGRARTAAECPPHWDRTECCVTQHHAVVGGGECSHSNAIRWRARGEVVLQIPAVARHARESISMLRFMGAPIVLIRNLTPGAVCITRPALPRCAQFSWKRA